MAVEARITLQDTDGGLLISTVDGASFLIKDRGDRPVLAMDSRIDMTKPVWAQVQKLAAKDRAAESKARGRRRSSDAA